MQPVLHYTTEGAPCTYDAAWIVPTYLGRIVSSFVSSSVPLNVNHDIKLLTCLVSSSVSRFYFSVNLIPSWRETLDQTAASQSLNGVWGKAVTFTTSFGISSNTFKRGLCGCVPM